MGRIYINQDVLKIELTYDALPGEVASAWIKYRNPAGTIGKLPGQVIHNSTGSSYYYIFSKGEALNDYGSIGIWNFWLYLELKDGRKIPGEIVDVVVFREGLK